MTSMPISQPDGAPALSSVLRAPDYIRTDPELVALYENSMRDLISEAKGLPMHTVQEFLLERIVTMYVTIRFRELHGWTTDGAAASTISRLQSVYTGAWVDMVKEWNKVLSSGQQQIRDQLVAEMTAIVIKGNEMIQDDNQRKAQRLFYAEQFAAKGM